MHGVAVALLIARMIDAQLAGECRGSPLRVDRADLLERGTVVHGAGGVERGWRVMTSRSDARIRGPYEGSAIA